MQNSLLVFLWPKAHRQWYLSVNLTSDWLCRVLLLLCYHEDNHRHLTTKRHKAPTVKTNEYSGELWCSFFFTPWFGTDNIILQQLSWWLILLENVHCVSLSSVKNGTVCMIWFTISACRLHAHLSDVCGSKTCKGWAELPCTNVKSHVDIWHKMNYCRHLACIPCWFQALFLTCIQPPLGTLIYITHSMVHYNIHI